MQVDLPVAYNQVFLAGNQLVDSARALVKEPSSSEAKSSLHTAAKGILEGTMKVFTTCRLEKPILHTSYAGVACVG